jgi:hypothetical protein
MNEYRETAALQTAVTQECEDANEGRTTQPKSFFSSFVSFRVGNLRPKISHYSDKRRVCPSIVRDHRLHVCTATAPRLVMDGSFIIAALLKKGSDNITS